MSRRLDQLRQAQKQTVGRSRPGRFQSPVAQKAEQDRAQSKSAATRGTKLSRGPGRLSDRRRRRPSREPGRAYAHERSYGQRGFWDWSGDGISLERGPSSSAVNDGELLTHQLAEWCWARRLLLERLPIMVPQRKSAARAARSMCAVRVRREGREAVERWTAVHSRYIFASLWP